VRHDALQTRFRAAVAAATRQSPAPAPVPRAAGPVAAVIDHAALALQRERDAALDRINALTRDAIAAGYKSDFIISVVTASGIDGARKRLGLDGPVLPTAANNYGWDDAIARARSAR
jgi:hypothetical protein